MKGHLLAVVLVLAACNKPAPSPAPAPAPAPSPAAAAYTVAAQPEPCRASGPCKVTFRVEAADGFHVNDQYPFKLIVDETPGVTYLGTPEPRTFTKASGDYAAEGPRLARMTARLKPAAAGKARVEGTLKLSVCSDESCLIEAPHVSADVDVAP